MITPRELSIDDVEALVSYLAQLTAESGRYGAPVYSPRSRNSVPPGERTVTALREGLARPLTEPGWRRGWVIAAGDQIVASVALAGAPLDSALHRAELSMGVLHAWRRRGYARALLRGAVAWADQQPGLDWIDLGVFTCNPPAVRLYEQHGFAAVGLVRDRFRVDGHTLDEQLMTRPISLRAQKISRLGAA